MIYVDIYGTPSEKFMTNRGEDLLIPCNEWVPPEELQGPEEKVLKHPIMEQAFQNILKNYEPRHDTCIVSLCCKTRPYGNGQKGKKFKQLFGDEADLIVCSNGGIIPEPYGNCYPYLNYTTNSVHNNKLYLNTCFNRLVSFLNKFHYKNVVFAFRPSLRNRKIADRILRECPDIADNIYVTPSIETGEQYRKEHKTIYGRLYPELHDLLIDDMENIFDEISQNRKKWKIFEKNHD